MKLRYAADLASTTLIVYKLTTCIFVTVEPRHLNCFDQTANVSLSSSVHTCDQRSKRAASHTHALQSCQIGALRSSESAGELDTELLSLRRQQAPSWETKTMRDVQD